VLLLLHAQEDLASSAAQYAHGLKWECAEEEGDVAHMYPEEGPAEDCESDAERALYYRLRERLGPDYRIVHSAKWHVTAPNGRLQAGEADFVVIHPARGLLVLEVKGGRMSHDARAGRWYVLDRNDHKDHIRDPFTQAMASAKVLQRKLRTVASTAPFAEQYRIGYGVWFPDGDWQRGVSGQLRLLDEQALDRRDLERPEEALGRLFALAHGTATTRRFA
jgi:Nuclease-related domain